MALNQLENTYFSTERGIRTRNYVQVSLCIRDSYQQLQRFSSLVISYLILRGHWCHITILNVHTPTGDEIDDAKDSFYVELECVFNKFLNYFETSLWS
jgi:hypothetical protein